MLDLGDEADEEAFILTHIAYLRRMCFILTTSGSIILFLTICPKGPSFFNMFF